MVGNIFLFPFNLAGSVDSRIRMQIGFIFIYSIHLSGGNGLKVSQTNVRFLSHPRL